MNVDANSMSAKNIKSCVTDSLGFELRVEIAIGTFEDPDTLGQHRTWASESDGKVEAGEIHRIEIGEWLEGDELAEVIAHEVYHLFFSVRHLITVGEETEATVFGQLVKHIHSVAKNMKLKTEQ